MLKRNQSSTDPRDKSLAQVITLKQRIYTSGVPDLSEPTTVGSLLDHLPWSNWHLRVVIALGVTWLLDGLEGSLGGSLAGALEQARSQGGLSLTDTQVGFSSSLYLLGAVLGALGFGYMADRWGRRRLFFGTLVLYVLATAATGFSWNLPSFTLFRVLTGAGIGGEYAAINSAIDELMPARIRGRIDLWINGTFWIGIILGSLVSVVLLSHPFFAHVPAWRLAFFSGVPIASVVLVMRRQVPESPRWLLARGHIREAKCVLADIEAQILGDDVNRVGTEKTDLRQTPAKTVNLATLLSAKFRRRTILCLILMIAQAFFYNSVFFSLALVLLHFYSASNSQVGAYFIPIGIANFLGPILLGRFFDTAGRRKMIGITYGLSGMILFASSLLFLRGSLTLSTQVGFWALTFFFASTAASSAYLTVSEVFPQQIRATAIAIFYAVGTLSGGVSGPMIFGRLIGSSQRGSLCVGYAIGAAGMIAAGLAGRYWGIDAEGKSLEELAAD